MARRHVGDELPIQRQLAARVGLSLDAPEGGALQHRHRLVVAGDGHVEDGLEQGGLVPEGLVDALHRHARRRRDGRHGGGGVAMLEEQPAGGLEHGPAVSPGLLLAAAGVVAPAELDGRRHPVETPLSVRVYSNGNSGERGSTCPTPSSTTCLAPRSCMGGSRQRSATSRPRAWWCTWSSRATAGCGTSTCGSPSRTGSATGKSGSDPPSARCWRPPASPSARPSRSSSSWKSSSSG